MPRQGSEPAQFARVSALEPRPSRRAGAALRAGEHGGPLPRKRRDGSEPCSTGPTHRVGSRPTRFSPWPRSPGSPVTAPATSTNRSGSKSSPVSKRWAPMTSRSGRSASSTNSRPTSKARPSATPCLLGCGCWRRILPADKCEELNRQGAKEIRREEEREFKERIHSDKILFRFFVPIFSLLSSSLFPWRTWRLGGSILRLCHLSHCVVNLTCAGASGVKVIGTFQT